MNREQWVNNTDREKLKSSEKSLSQSYFVHHKSNIHNVIKKKVCFHCCTEDHVLQCKENLQLLPETQNKLFSCPREK
jgi:hypothetical protein